MAQGRDLAIVTLVACDGPVGMPVGSRLVVDAQGEACGFLAGPALDAAMRAEALAVIAGGEPRLLDFELPSGHACVYVERLG